MSGSWETDPRRRIMIGAEGPSTKELIQRCLHPGDVEEPLDPRQRIMIGDKGPSKKELIKRCLKGSK